MSEETAVAVLDDYTPVQDKDQMLSLVETREEELLAILPKHVKKETMLQWMLSAINKTPSLAGSTAGSIVESLYTAASLGLEIAGPNQHCWILPFNVNVGGATEKRAQCIIGYRGLVKLARQSGDVVRIEAEEVWTNDTFEYEKGTNPKCRLVPEFKDRGELMGFYFLAELKDGSVQTEFMTKAEVEKVRNGAHSKNSPAWKNHFGQMGRKTVLRRGMKLLDLSPERFDLLLKGFEVDDADYDWQNAKNVTPTPDNLPEPTTKGERILKAIQGGGNAEPAPEEVDHLTGGEVGALKRLMAKHGVDEEKLRSYLVEVEGWESFKEWTEIVPGAGETKDDLKAKIRAGVEALSELE